MAVRSQQKTDVKGDKLLRTKGVLGILPVSKSTWWAGVKNGKYPKPVYVGPRMPCWWESEILALGRREG